MRYAFNVKKYKEWRMAHEGLDEETIDFIIRENHIANQDGCYRDILVSIGKIILKDWCDEVNDTRQ